MEKMTPKICPYHELVVAETIWSRNVCFVHLKDYTDKKSISCSWGVLERALVLEDLSSGSAILQVDIEAGIFFYSLKLE